MTIFPRIIAALWITMILYWIISAWRAKRRAHGTSRWRGIGARVVLLILALMLAHSSHSSPFLGHLRSMAADAPPGLRLLGVIVCASGIAFAIWARHHLGRNWGMPMSLQQGHEMVTTGPYQWVRHPIYTGILFGLLGSALTEGGAWLLLLLISTAYFIYSAKTEEKLMRHEFPNDYPAYQTRTKMLIPFLW